VEAGEKLKQQGMKRLILDLRNNGGGLLDQAFLVADEFLKGDTIVYTRGRRTENDQVFVARTGQTMEDIPLIVLINGASASASEITAGSIQDLDRGLVVGVTSFGKGLVQRQFPIRTDGSAVRLTTARFYTASGRCIQRPFKDIDAWRKLTDRLELEEGANLEHTLDKIKREEATREKNAKKGADSLAIDLDSIEIFYTRNGRPVLGGGGITPDYVVRHDDRKLTDLTLALWRNGVFFQFIDKYVNEMKEKYGDDYRRFGDEFKLTDRMIKDLQKIAEEKEIEWDAEEFEIDKEWYEERHLKFHLARALWNRNTATQLTITTDRQLNKALELFPLAEKIQLSKNKKR
jgi:carboxyl-terminal processing protease